MLSGVEQMPDSISLPLSVPMKKLMYRHVQEGAIFVQRKSGADLIGSLDKLNLIQSRMQVWARPGGCWLLATDIGADEDWKVIAGGHSFDRSLASILVKIQWWNMRGGHAIFLSTDDEIDSWLDTMVTTLGKILDNPIRFCQENDPFLDKPPMQTLVQTDADWLTTGAAFPKGWGIKKRTAVYDSLVKDSLPATLLNALERINVGKVAISGIGPALRRSCREWSGWSDSIDHGLDRYQAAYGKGESND
jgi:hypothetical protein